MSRVPCLSAGEAARRLVESSPDLNVLLDAAGRIVYAAPSACGLLGVSGPLSGRVLADLVHDDDAPVLAAAIRASAASPRPVTFEARDAAGSRWLEGAITPLAAGGSAVAAHDATVARATASRALVRSRQQETVAEVGRISLAEPDLELVLGSIVETVARTLGVAAATVLELRETGEAVVRAESGPQARVGGAVSLDGTPAELCLRSGEPVVVDGTIVAPIGSRARAWGLLIARDDDRGRFDEDDVAFMRGVANVLAHAFVRARLESSRAFQSYLLANVGEAVVAYDLDWRITAWNRAAERIYGWRAEECIGLNARELLRSDYGDPTREDVEHELLAHGGWRGEIEDERKDGVRIAIDSNVLRLDDGRGRPAGYVAVNRDITQRKALELQLRHAQKMEAVGRLAGGVAHDFNNLLTVISGYLAFALDRLDETDVLRRDLEAAAKAADSAAALTQQLLAFSRRQIVRPRAVDLGQKVRELEFMLSRTIGEDVELVTVLAPGAGAVHVDPDQLEQALVNLAVNARDAMPAGGRLVIETANVDIGPEWAAAHDGSGPPGRYVLLSVSDTGTGMDEVTRAHIFEPFFTTKDVGHGTGLGLSTVYGIVQQAGGFVSVYSEPGRGSTFKLYFPWTKETPAEPATPAAAPASGSETVLLVEDDAAVRAVTSAMLARHSYAVLEAAGPEEALALLGRDVPDVVVTDVVMPTMNGRELVSKLRASRPDLPVVFTSGYPRLTAFGTEDLADGEVFLSKPFDAASLGVAVREALRGS